MIKRFMIIIDKNKIPTLYDGAYVAGIFQGLLYGLCAIPCGTTLWDCESFSSMFVICVDCTHDHIEKFKSIIDNKYPGAYKIKESGELP